MFRRTHETLRKVAKVVSTTWGVPTVVHVVPFKIWTKGIVLLLLFARWPTATQRTGDVQDTLVSAMSDEFGGTGVNPLVQLEPFHRPASGSWTVAENGFVSPTATQRACVGHETPPKAGRSQLLCCGTGCAAQVAASAPPGAPAHSAHTTTNTTSRRMPGLYAHSDGSRGNGVIESEEGVAVVGEVLDRALPQGQPPTGQIAFVVDDIDATAAAWVSLGIGPWSVWTFDDRMLRTRTFRGDPGTFAARVALCSVGPLTYELVEPIAGPSIWDDFVGPESARPHHLGYYVDDMDSAVAAMAERGFAAVQTGTGFGVDGDGAFAYFDTLGAFGCYFEAILSPRALREPDAVISLA